MTIRVICNLRQKSNKMILTKKPARRLVFYAFGNEGLSSDNQLITGIFAYIDHASI